MGSGGALALLAETGELVVVFDMPLLNGGPTGRPVTSPALLTITVKSHAVHAIAQLVDPPLR